MKFRKYQHVSKLGNLETRGLLDGICHVFYKIDGTNASIWMEDDGSIGCGSRNRELSLNSDNAGFCQWVMHNRSKFENLFKETLDDVTLYGEWLVPHSLKTYREEAWRDFYVFDVVDSRGNHVAYDDYKPALDHFGINYIPPIATIKNPTEEQLSRFLEKSGDFLIKDGMGKGEGIVIKNYEYINPLGRQTWGKIVTNEFKEKHSREMGAPSVNNTITVEEKIVANFLSEEFIKKEISKISLENEGWDNRFLPRLFGVVTHEFIKDEIHNILKKYKNPKIDFGFLYGCIVRKCKDTIN